MEKSHSVLKFQTSSQPDIHLESGNYTCTRCGKSFTSPIFAVNNSPGIAEGYYACPSCLSKVEIKKEEPEVTVAKAAEPKIEAIVHETVKIEEPVPVEVKEEPSTSTSTPASPVCQHYQGYLKKRPKGAPMPDECFTCTLMLDCMH